MSPEGFWSRVDQSAGFFECWPWTGAQARGGYGHLRWAGRTVASHRVAYELLVGPIPVSLQIDHLCRNRICANPAHMEPVTPGENTRRSPIVGRLPSQRNQGWGASHPLGRRDRCKSGHLFDEANTRRRPDGSRGCRTCQREWWRSRHPDAPQRHKPGRAA